MRLIHWFLKLGVMAAAIMGNSGALATAETANPQASGATRKVLTYFQELAARTEGPRLLSGQFSDFGEGASLGLMAQIHERTGHWPAMIGVDYADFGRGGLTFAKPNAAASAYWHQGGLVTVSAHLYNPANPKGGGLRDKGVHFSALLEPGETRERWLKEMGQLGDGLQALQRDGVVVLWRPFHEMNGGWFWWGAQEPAQFIAVWREMFNYLSKTRGLDNLLWVYAPNHGDKTAAYYPGDAYVDMVGFDAYTDFIDPDHIRGYAELAALLKPFGFSEFGPHGPQHPPADYDYRRFLTGVTNHFPKVRYFKAWNGGWSLGTNQFTREFLSDPVVINRENLPSGLAGSSTGR